MDIKNLDKIDFKLAKKLGIDPHNAYIIKDKTARIVIIDSGVIIEDNGIVNQSFKGILDAYRIRRKGSLIKRLEKEHLGELHYDLNQTPGKILLDSGFIYAKHNRIRDHLISCFENIGNMLEGCAPITGVTLSCHIYDTDHYRKMGYKPLSGSTPTPSGFINVEKINPETTVFDNNIKALYDEVYETNFAESEDQWN